VSSTQSVDSVQPEQSRPVTRKWGKWVGQSCHSYLSGGWSHAEDILTHLGTCVPFLCMIT
jgi:hypothetical protein